MLSSFAISVALSIAPTVHVRVQGEGYLRMVHRGHAVYASQAALTIQDGLLSDECGAVVVPTVRVPSSATRVEIDREGNVYAVMPSFRARAGRLSLALFSRYADRRAYGEFFVSASQPRVEFPSEGGAGVIETLSVPPPKREMVEVPRPSAPATRVEPNAAPQPEALRTAEASMEAVAPPTGAARIEVLRRALADGDRVLLHEIAYIEAPEELASALANVEVADTPVIGKHRKIRRDQVEKALRSAGFDPDRFDLEMPSRVTVQRRAQRVPTGEIYRVAVEAAREVCETSGPLVAKVKESEVMAPVGELELVAEACVPTRDGAAVIVVTKVDGERFNSRLVRVKAESR